MTTALILAIAGLAVLTVLYEIFIMYGEDRDMSQRKKIQKDFDIRRHFL